MRVFAKKKLFVFSALCVISIIAWLLQDVLLMNWDVSWDLLAAKRLAAGGTYTHDFFDLNPPLILYLFVPANFFANLFSISVPLAFRIYIIGLAYLSLSLCYPLIQSIFLKAHMLLAHVFFLLLACVFLIFPLADFGQREHLLLIFTVPYFLGVIYQLQGNKIYVLYALGIGLFAVMGFALKPYFVMSFILVELYIMYHTRDLFSWLRADAIIIIVLLLAYLAFIFAFYPDYVSTVVPIAMHFYYEGFKSPWIDVLFSPLIVFCYMVILFFITQRKQNPYALLLSVLFLALAGFMCSYFAQKTHWPYHAFPAFSIALLMMTLLFGWFCIEHKNNILLIPLLSVLLCFIPWIYVQTSYKDKINHTKEQKPLTTFLHTHAYHQPVYFITANVMEIFPAVDYADSIYASRLLHFFWVPGMVKSASKHTPAQFPLLTKYAKSDEFILIDMVAEDIETKKPKFIFVDTKKHKIFFQSYLFDYLPYLLKNRHFQSAWKSYHYLNTLEVPSEPIMEQGNLHDSPAYRYQIYQRQE